MILILAAYQNEINISFTLAAKANSFSGLLNFWSIA